MKNMQPMPPAEGQLEGLKGDLRLATRAVLALLDTDVQEIADRYRLVNSEEQLNSWENQLIEATMSKAIILSEEELLVPSGSPRAVCPLCKRGSSAPYEVGFAYPNGLKMHLAGDGNAQRCAITDFLWTAAWRVVQRQPPACA